MTDVLALTTPAQVKRYLRMTPAQIAAGGAAAPAGVTSVDDGIIQDLVNAVSEAFAGYCGRNFKRDAFTERRNGTGTNSMVLINYPVISITSLSIVAPRSSASATTPTNPLTEDVDFVFDTRGRVQLFSIVFPKGVANVLIDYLAGYSTPPSDLSHAAAKWAAVRYREMDRLGQRSKTLGGETVSFDMADCPPDVLEIVRRYESQTPISGSAIGSTS